MPHTSALFIDFDNFFSGLLAADPAAALDVVTKPSMWLNRLTRDDGGEPARRWLVLRCYVNPAGSVSHPTKANERLYFSTFRPYFTQAGIEMVDCPPLTKRAKNGADIRITVDVMTALRGETRYDEFVIASSDADFTPLLQVLRAHDRRVTVISTGNSTAAYEALADHLLDEQDVIELTQPGGEQLSSERVMETVPDPSPAAGDEVWEESEYEKFASIVRSHYVEADAPINLATLSMRLRAELGDVTTRTGWFGAGGFGKALRSLELPNVEFSQHVLFDPDRHEAPHSSTPTPAVARPAMDLPPVIAKFRQITKLPALATTDWVQVHQSLAAYACLHEFNFTEATRWARDHAAEAGHEISRAAFTYVTRACNAVGPPLYADPPPTEDQIAAALLENVLKLARQSGVDVTDADVRALAEWVGAEPGPVSDLQP
ncbi:NYN domain-containing protein [Serinicoccus chungangensis]|uniref:NYN domain-containing protein n=1 Tax=Serinicoccus chungangensis TaxID=767452 RepID=UPI00111837B4|nr:NYN domain-containing protein [Serinicoccus chungangensis]